MRRIRNFILLLRYWNVLSTSAMLINDRQSMKAIQVLGNMSQEEYSGANSLEAMHRILTLQGKDLKRDLARLEAIYKKEERLIS